MTSETDHNAICERVQNLLRPALRQENKWMKDDALQGILERTIESLKRELVDQEPIIAETKKRCSFFSLSAELRNRIYEEVFEPDVPRSIPFCTEKWLWRHPQEMALLHTCHRVRDEALPVSLANPWIFQVVIYHREPDQIARVFLELKTWLRTLGPTKVAMVKSLILHFPLVKDRLNLAMIMKKLDPVMNGTIDAESVNGKIVAETLGLEEYGVPPSKVAAGFGNILTAAGTWGGLAFMS